MQGHLPGLQGDGQFSLDQGSSVHILAVIPAKARFSGNDDLFSRSLLPDQLSIGTSGAKLACTSIHLPFILT